MEHGEAFVSTEKIPRTPPDDVNPRRSEAIAGPPRIIQGQIYGGQQHFGVHGEHEEYENEFDEYGGMPSPQKRGNPNLGPQGPHQLQPTQALPLHQQYVYQRQMQSQAYQQQMRGPQQNMGGPGQRRGRPGY